MKRGLTSIVMPLYNGGAWIEETLRSVHVQTSRPAEVIVVDDGSTDGSPEIAAAFPWVTLIRNPGKGANAARAYGLMQTTRPLVTMLDQDDIWAPWHLEQLECVATDHPQANAVFGGAILFYSSQTLRFGESSDECASFDPWERLPIATIPTPSQVLMRRDVLLSRGGWTQRFLGVADQHAWLRLAADQPLVSLRRASMGYRQHHTSYSSKLRANDPVAAVRRLLDAAQDVMELRRRLRPELVAAAEAKLRLAECMAGWLALQHARESSARLQAAAEALERELQAHEPVHADALWRQLFYYYQKKGGWVSMYRRGLFAARLLGKARLQHRHLHRSLRRVVLGALGLRAA